MLNPGHYYSPYPNLDYIEEHYSDDKFEFSTEALNINAEEINITLNRLSAFRDLIKFADDKSEEQFYFANNTFFRYADAWVYAAMIHHLRPQRIIEIGSGFSTALAMDVNRSYFNNEIKIRSIDPDMSRMHAIIGNQRPNIELEPTSVLDIDIDCFKTLNANDILFVDSSHVLKQGSDVNYILFEVLPVLKKGVVIHFHDIFLFNYPKQWFMQYSGWNESYALRAFLCYNSAFSMLFLNKFVTTYMRDACNNIFPELLVGHGGSSLYIVKDTLEGNEREKVT